MKNRGFLILLILVIFCMGVSVGFVSANDNSTSYNLTMAENTEQVDTLNAADNDDSSDNLSQSENSDENLSQIVDSNTSDNLATKNDNSDEVLSKQVNSSDEVLSSSVIVYSNHVYKVGKYTFKLSDKQYNDLKNHKVHYVRVNSKDFKTVKIPKYKNKKVIKYKWKYKKVRWEGLTPYPYTGIKLANLKSYYNSGWKKVRYGYETAYNSNRFLGYNYAILKKKVYYTKTKKVKSGYKKVKLRVSAQIGLTGGNFDELYIHIYIGDYSIYHYYKSLGWYYTDL